MPSASTAEPTHSAKRTLDDADQSDSMEVSARWCLACAPRRNSSFSDVAAMRRRWPVPHVPRHNDARRTTQRRFVRHVRCRTQYARVSCCMLSPGSMLHVRSRAHARVGGRHGRSVAREGRQVREHARQRSASADAARSRRCVGKLPAAGHERHGLPSQSACPAASPAPPSRTVTVACRLEVLSLSRTGGAGACEPGHGARKADARIKRAGR